MKQTNEEKRALLNEILTEGVSEIYAKHDCSEQEIAYARMSDKYKTVQRELNSAKALIADIKEFDVESFLYLPHELRKRMQAILDS